MHNPGPDKGSLASAVLQSKLCQSHGSKTWILDYNPCPQSLWRKKKGKEKRKKEKRKDCNCTLIF